jgi:broad specificity phosphatase PhoE
MMSDFKRSASKRKAIAVAIALLGAILPGFATAVPTIYLVRHAERAAISGRVPSDTGLSPQGETRAKALASLLKDAGITAIYTSEYRRTQQTAAPLAKLLGIRPQVIPADDIRSLVAKLRASTGNVLVVGHSNTLPSLLNALGITARVTIAESDYDNLFEVTLRPKPELVRRHYP